MLRQAAIFRVDTDQLSQLIEQMTRFDQHLESMLDEVETKVTQLHATWTGAAAAARQQAHNHWKHGAQEMRDTLTAMRLRTPNNIDHGIG